MFVLVKLLKITCKVLHEDYILFIYQKTEMSMISYPTLFLMHASYYVEYIL